MAMVSYRLKVEMWVHDDPGDDKPTGPAYASALVVNGHLQSQETASCVYCGCYPQNFLRRACPSGFDPQAWLDSVEKTVTEVHEHNKLWDRVTRPK